MATLTMTLGEPVLPFVNMESALDGKQRGQSTPREHSNLPSNFDGAATLITLQVLRSKLLTAAVQDMKWFAGRAQAKNVRDRSTSFDDDARGSENRCFFSGNLALLAEVEELFIRLRVPPKLRYLTSSVNESSESSPTLSSDRSKSLAALRRQLESMVLPPPHLQRCSSQSQLSQSSVHLASVAHILSLGHKYLQSTKLEVRHGADLMGEQDLIHIKVISKESDHQQLSTTADHDSALEQENSLHSDTATRSSEDMRSASDGGNADRVVVTPSKQRPFSPPPTPGATSSWSSTANEFLSPPSLRRTFSLALESGEPLLASPSSVERRNTRTSNDGASAAPAQAVNEMSVSSADGKSQPEMLRLELEQQGEVLMARHPQLRDVVNVVGICIVNLGCDDICRQATRKAFQVRGVGAESLPFLA